MGEDQRRLVEAVSARTQPRLPFGPLRRYVGAINTSDAARRLGLHVRVVQRYAQEGVPLSQADRIAVLAGAVPVELWGDLFLELEAKLDDHRRLLDHMARQRMYDRERLLAGLPRSKSWAGIERAHGQWQQQRQRFAYDRLDRQAEQTEGEAAA